MYPAPWGSVFVENAFRGAIGKDIRLVLGDQTTKAHVHDAEVIDDGQAVEVTMSVDRSVAERIGITHDPSHYSFMEVDDAG